MTKQETFDTIITHLRKQNCAASENMHCRYRTSDGRKCAAGCLIPDEMYDPTLEGIGLRSMCGQLNRTGYLIKELGHDVGLVAEMQYIHDRGDTTKWEEAFKRVAIAFNLEHHEIS